MSKKVKIALVAGLLAGITPMAMTFITSDIDTARLGITMLVSLFLVLGVYSAVKQTLFEDLQGIYERRPMFKSGMMVTAFCALLYSFGSMANDAVFEEKLYNMKLENGEALLAEWSAKEDKTEDDERIVKELAEKIEAFKEGSAEKASPLVGGANKVLFVMLFGSLYSFVIPMVLRQSPRLKGVKKK